MLVMNLELLKTLTILYVEDEATLQEEIYQNVSPFVKNVIRANDGLEGLQLFKENKTQIDLIISDILMPNLNGIDMVNAIRKLDKDVPIIYTTAFNDTEYMKQTIEQTIISYILKPVDIELLLNAIVKASVVIENNELKNTLRHINQELEAKIVVKTKELQQQNIKLAEQLHSDELTSLGNRKALRRDLQKLKHPIMIIVNIDSFKSINDLYGEDVGNEVLVDIGSLLKNLAREYSFNIYRIGSDEFALIRDGEFNEHRCKDIANLIVNEVNNHSIYIIQNDITLRIDVSIGISKDNKETLQKAGMALKKAKEERIAYQIYDDTCSLDVEYENDIKWTREIERAINMNDVIAYFQPIVDQDAKIIKYEALMRLRDGEKIYSPYLFLDIAKKVKFYPRLTKIMINAAFEKAQESQKDININLSIEDMESENIIEFIKNGLVEKNIAHLITFEVLESESVKDYKKIIDFIQIVKYLGCTIAIDDFGSGYSNFSYLLKLEPNYIKIDGSLVKDIHTNKDSYMVTNMINEIAHSMGMRTVAEFVHCKEVYDVLKDIGVDLFQGYYFSEPKATL